MDKKLKAKIELNFIKNTYNIEFILKELNEEYYTLDRTSKSVMAKNGINLYNGIAYFSISLFTRTIVFPNMQNCLANNKCLVKFIDDKARIDGLKKIRDALLDWSQCHFFLRYSKLFEDKPRIKYNNKEWIIY